MEISCKGKGIYVRHKATESGVCAPTSAQGQLKLIFVKQGEVAYTVNEKTYYPRKNSLIIVHPWKSHYIAAQKNVLFDRYEIRINFGGISGDIWVQAWESVEVDVINCDGDAQMCSLFPKLDEYAAYPEDENLDTQLLRLCEQILENAMRIIQSTGAENSYMANPIVARAVEYIHDHITQPIRMEEIARELNITKRYLYRLFAEHMKTTPQKYIVSRKLQLAQRELRAGRKAAEVCASYSFPDYPSFYRHYTRYFGHKPSDARKT